MKKILAGFILMIALAMVGSVSAADLPIDGTMPAVIQCTWTRDNAYPLYPWWEAVDGSGHPVAGAYNDVENPLSGPAPAENKSDAKNIADLDTYANLDSYHVAISATNAGHFKQVDEEGEWLTGGYTIGAACEAADHYLGGTAYSLGAFPTYTVTGTGGVLHKDFRFYQTISATDTNHPGDYKMIVTASVTV